LENDHFLKRLDAGLATLQSIDMCIAEVCFQMGTSTRDRIAQLLKLKGGDFSTVGRIVLGKGGVRPLCSHMKGIRDPRTQGFSFCNRALILEVGSLT